MEIQPTWGILRWGGESSDEVGNPQMRWGIHRQGGEQTHAMGNKGPGQGFQTFPQGTTICTSIGTLLVTSLMLILSKHVSLPLFTSIISSINHKKHHLVGHHPWQWTEIEGYETSPNTPQWLQEYLRWMLCKPSIVTHTIAAVVLHYHTEYCSRWYPCKIRQLQISQ